MEITIAALTYCDRAFFCCTTEGSDNCSSETLTVMQHHCMNSRRIQKRPIAHIDINGKYTNGILNNYVNATEEIGIVKPIELS